MAKKKRVRRVIKTKLSKVAEKSVRVVRPKRLQNSSGRKIGIVIKNLILFTILSLISWILYGVSSVTMYENLFFLLAVILGFVAVAFLIVLLVLLILRLIAR